MRVRVTGDAAGIHDGVEQVALTGSGVTITAAKPTQTDSHGQVSPADEELIVTLTASGGGSLPAEWTTENGALKREISGPSALNAEDWLISHWTPEDDNTVEQTDSPDGQWLRQLNSDGSHAVRMRVASAVQQVIDGLNAAEPFDLRYKGGDATKTVFRLGAANTEMGFFGAAPVAKPQIPATPTAQDIADVLVALGLATQAA